MHCRAFALLFDDLKSLTGQVILALKRICPADYLGVRKEMPLTAAEQYLIELVNRGRLDPLAEANRYNLSLNDNLAPGTITGDSLQVLAPNDALDRAATAHSAWMLTTDTFSHTGANGTNAGDRMAASGYVFTGTWTWRENLAWVGSTGGISQSDAIANHYEGLYRSAGHRANTFAASVGEIGVGQVIGNFSQGGRSYNSSMLTENFASSGNSTFVTGVAYQDMNGDNFYSIGEGKSNVWFQTNGGSTTTAQAGGYGIDVGQTNTANVTVGSGNLPLANVTLDMSNGNAKLDLVTDANGHARLELSTNATLHGGVSDATLLGSANLALTGDNNHNELNGNRGANNLTGLGGRDDMFGRGGSDLIDGGSGNDRIFGNNGNDFLIGRSGDDRLWGGAGRDRLWGGDQNDRLDGQGGNDYMDGGRGFDDLIGRAGDDVLRGGAGRDRLWGGDGNDRLDGQAGNDRMEGGRGADTFIFSGHNDVIVDFEDNVDTIQLRGAVWNIGNMTVAEVINMGTVSNGNAYFDFGGGHRLTLIGVDNLDVLANDLVII